VKGHGHSTVATGRRRLSGDGLRLSSYALARASFAHSNRQQVMYSGAKQVLGQRLQEHIPSQRPPPIEACDMVNTQCSLRKVQRRAARRVGLAMNVCRAGGRHDNQVMHTVSHMCGRSIRSASRDNSESIHAT
jgi:hypothetical protein